MLKQLAMIGIEPEEINELLANESERDPTSTGEKSQISVRAAVAEIKNKQKWLREIQDENTELSLAKLRAAMGYLLSDTQHGIKKELLDEILLPLPELDQTREQQFLKSYVRSLISGYCEAGSVSLLQQAIDSNKKSSLSVSKALKIALQEDERCLNIKDKVI